MKKQFLLIAGLVATVFASEAGAQLANVSRIQIAATATENTSRNTMITPAQRRFHMEFPGVINDVWIKTASGYTVRYSDKGIQHWAFLNKKGNVVSQMRYYTAKDVPATIQRMVKSSYYDVAITSAKEIINGAAVVYLVTVEDAASWKVIHIMEGELNVHEEHAK
ncbi:MAG TPA: hypothetical protein VEZ55_11645 [Chitinophagaceae bacterium]|jgi:hypothetical protein|nr:hypothetical protein [Chitinophagaceae bacterium]